MATSSERLKELQEVVDDALKKLFERDFGRYPENEVIGVAISALHERLMAIEVFLPESGT